MRMSWHGPPARKGEMLCLIRHRDPHTTLKSRVTFRAASGYDYTAVVGTRTP